MEDVRDELADGDIATFSGPVAHVDDDRGAGELGDDLAAGPAGREEVLRLSDDQDLPDLPLPGRDHGEDGAPLGAAGQAVAGAFEIARDVACRGAERLSHAVAGQSGAVAGGDVHRVAQFAQRHGIEILLVDSDGYIERLTELMLESGVTAMYPYEVQAGNDCFKMLDTYPKLGIVGGLNKERFTLRFPFAWKSQRRLFDAYVNLQRRLGITRRIPDGIVPHLGSQWWCLTRHSLQAILNHPDRARHDRYFRRVWIPDESYFQTLIRQVSTRVESRSLTLSKFDFQGRPHIFYDDHLHLLRRTDAFVARKIWPQADVLYDTYRSPTAALAARREPTPGKIDRLFVIVQKSVQVVCDRISVTADDLSKRVIVAAAHGIDKFMVRCRSIMHGDNSCPCAHLIDLVQHHTFILLYNTMPVHTKTALRFQSRAGGL